MFRQGRYAAGRPARRVSPAFGELVKGVTDKVVQIACKRGYNFVTHFTSNLDHFMFRPGRYAAGMPALRVSPAFGELVKGVTDEVVQIAGKRGYNFVTPFTSNLDHFMFRPGRYAAGRPARRVPHAFGELVNGVTDKVVQIAGKRGYNFVTPFTSNL